MRDAVDGGGLHSDGREVGGEGDGGRDVAGLAVAAAEQLGSGRVPAPSVRVWVGAAASPLLGRLVPLRRESAQAQEALLPSLAGLGEVQRGALCEAHRRWAAAAAAQQQQQQQRGQGAGGGTAAEAVPPQEKEQSLLQWCAACSVVLPLEGGGGGEVAAA